MVTLPYESTVLDIISRIDELEGSDPFEDGPTILAEEPWTAASAAVVLADDVIDEVVDGTAPGWPEYRYLLEVEIAAEVLEVWSAWRGGAKPTPEEAVAAVIHYAAHDAYLPAD
jgi:hypothetical protein